MTLHVRKQQPQRQRQRQQQLHLQQQILLPAITTTTHDLSQSDLGKERPTEVTT